MYQFDDGFKRGRGEIDTEIEYCMHAVLES